MRMTMININLEQSVSKKKLKLLLKNGWFWSLFNTTGLQFPCTIKIQSNYYFISLVALHKNAALSFDCAI